MSKSKSLSISDFRVSPADSARVDMTRAVVATEGFRWLKEFGSPLAYWDKVPAEAANNPEDWEIVGEIYVDETYFDEYEGKWEFVGTTTLLIAPIRAGVDENAA